jgi:hypothetical protein
MNSFCNVVFNFVELSLSDGCVDDTSVAYKYIISFEHTARSMLVRGHTKEIFS